MRPVLCFNIGNDLFSKAAYVLLVRNKRSRLEKRTARTKAKLLCICSVKLHILAWSEQRRARDGCVGLLCVSALCVCFVCRLCVSALCVCFVRLLCVTAWCDSTSEQKTHHRFTSCMRVAKSGSRKRLLDPRLQALERHKNSPKASMSVDPSMYYYCIKNLIFMISGVGSHLNKTQKIGKAGHKIPQGV